ncbi:Uncharacterised protein [Algoriella xinjiangensis]|uniref:hypothetical protein n=1 Tax=Algoriella xinjiangensis TaxID=684065 RepID=UPI000F9C9152|nr:hypothetical protein [Algoriella xinjiangensis]VDH16119.1 Uncharacterised protein [Algoriella xinjiangensis]
MKYSRRKHGTPSIDLRKIIIDLKFSIIQDKRVYNNLSLNEKVKLKRFVKIKESK